MSYNFKTIKTVLPSKDLINVILSKTQRKTPTVVHAGFQIGRIRTFYARKIKFTQESIQEKLEDIVQTFPKLDDIHPFYADLINVLYDRDHYKLALGHIHSCKNLIDNIVTDYLKLLKYADSLYRCKTLKKAALGRMCTTLKKLSSSLNYLEEVRKHLSRLPQINPYERTLLITGYPNVGKSSFINQITHANVEVQPYPFTTQSLYVGHSDYNFIRHQVIDTPGLLDHPLESRNTIEMQSITAMAHLKAAVLFFIDISETCSYSIQAQVELFQSLKPLFKNKPIVMVLTKIDIQRYEDLDQGNKDLIEELQQQENITCVQLSNKTGDGIGAVKNQACSILEEFRSKVKVDQISGGNQNIHHEENVQRGIYIAKPKNDKQPYNKEIPESVRLNGKTKLNRPTLKEIQEEHGGAGCFTFPLQEHFMLEKEEWKYDAIPEIMDGKNIKDFVDKDILNKLEQLEQEEEMLMQQDEMDIEGDSQDSEMQEEKVKVFNKLKLKKLKHKIDLKNQTHKKNQKLSEVVENLEKAGKETSLLKERIRSKSKRKPLRNFNKEDDTDNEMEFENEENGLQKQIKSKLRSQSRSRSKGHMPDKNRSKVKDRAQKGWIGGAGEADRRIANMKPRWLFSGKRGNGSNDRR